MAGNTCKATKKGKDDRTGSFGFEDKLLKVAGQLLSNLDAAEYRLVALGTFFLYVRALAE